MYVGIDLAWSTRRPTGVAVADASGRLLSSGSVLTDRELADWLMASAPQADVVAIDAPLVVPNATGQRVCERLIGKAFGRYNASAHVSNRSRSYFDPPRAEVLARRQGWNIDPDAASGPQSVEVYPHPAMVGLWRLPTVIPYKAKTGRSVAQRQAAFHELLSRLESVDELALVDHSRWAAIREAVATAARHVDLERVEDEIDAIFCAHLAWLWRHRPGALQVYGDIQQGYIVAPPPPSHPAARRRAGPLPEQSVSFSVSGRPTGYAGGQRELEWKAAVRANAATMEVDAAARFRLDIHFRLHPLQRGHLEPDLDNLVKSTVDALDGVLGARPGRFQGQADDVRINELSASKRWAATSSEAGADITVSVLLTAPIPNPPSASGTGR